MNDRKNIAKSGFTLTELVLVSAMVTTCITTLAVVFHDNQKAWNDTYKRAYDAVMLDSQLASRAFEATVRKATSELYLIDSTGQWVEVYYYATETSPNPDRYARMSMANGDFCIDYGTIDPRASIAVTPVCENVTSCSFSSSGQCIRMHMTLSDNDHDVNFISSAVPQNQ